MSYSGLAEGLISIHALREESDDNCIRRSYNRIQFLSTLSVRRATYSKDWATRIMLISIHALREESDWFTPAYDEAGNHFYPRSP